MAKKYITVRFPEKLTVELNKISDVNEEVKSFVIGAIEEYVDQHMFAEYLETEKSEIQSVLIEKMQNIMDRKIWLLDQIIKDYVFAREGDRDDKR